MKPRRVLFLVTAFPRHEGDVITPWLTAAMHHLATLNVEAEVLAPAWRGSPSQRFEGIRVHRFRYAPARWERLTHEQTAADRIREQPLSLGLLPGYLASGTAAAIQLARSGRFDVLHALWPIPQGVLGALASRASGVPLVSSFFGAELALVASVPRLLVPVLRQVAAASAALTVNSSITLERLRALLPDAHAEVLPFGVSGSAPPEAPWVPSQTPRLLFIGRLVERKGLHTLLDALARIASEKGPERTVPLDVVGDGPERARLEAQARRLGLSDRVLFHGFISSEDKAARLSRCHALVLPAVRDDKGDEEGQGVVLLEAMAFGRPVVSTRSGGIVDTVRHRETGLLMEPGDTGALAEAIQTLVVDPALAQRMGAAGRKRWEAHFSWPVLANRFVEVYRSVCDHAAPGAPLHL